MAVVFIVDPGAATRVQAPQILARMFGLTRKEAEIAAMLAAGKRHRDNWREKLGMCYETARTHMRRNLQ